MPENLKTCPHCGCYIRIVKGRLKKLKKWINAKERIDFLAWVKREGLVYAKDTAEEAELLVQFRRENPQ